MTAHEAINSAMQKFVDEHHDCATISPTAMAADAFAAFSEDAVESHIAYAALEHFKHIARKILASRFGHEDVANPAYAEQGELFSGHLQERYPTPRKAGEEPQYKLLELLTEAEARWNIRSLRRSARARLDHADHFEAWLETKFFRRALPTPAAQVTP